MRPIILTSQSSKRIVRELSLMFEKKKEKKKIFIFFAARFIVSEVVMTRNYPDIITYTFL